MYVVCPYARKCKHPSEIQHSCGHDMVHTEMVDCHNPCAVRTAKKLKTKKCRHATKAELVFSKL